MKKTKAEIRYERIGAMPYPRPAVNATTLPQAVGVALLLFDAFLAAAALNPHLGPRSGWAVELRESAKVLRAHLDSLRADL